MVATDKNIEKLDTNSSNPPEIPESNGKDAGEKQYEFSGLSDTSASQSSANMELILDIPLEITVEVGRTRILIAELLKLGQGSVVELTKVAGETLEIFANKKLIARGEVVVIKEKYGIRITEIVSPMERIEGLK
ncbi:MAG: flagellar motor switch protein FliN [Deltaproteobacteria bacterium]|nr:flagellar motor switch protein FliN [Deltaproteobacteria bacterium]